MKDKLDLTERETIALNVLIDRMDWVSPGEIGGAIYSKLRVGSGHSSTGSPVCKKLVEKGLAERNDKGWYKCINTLTAH